MSCEAEHTNGDEDGQDNIKDHNGYYRPHVDHITGTTFCGREKRLEDKTQTHHHHHRHVHSASHRSERFRKVTYLAVLLQFLKDREWNVRATATSLQPVTVKTQTAHHSPNIEPTMQRALDISFMLVSGKGGNATCPSVVFQMAALLHPWNKMMDVYRGRVHRWPQTILVVLTVSDGARGGSPLKKRKLLVLFLCEITFRRFQRSHVIKSRELSTLSL